MTAVTTCQATTATDRDAWVADPAEILIVLPALNEAEHIEACLRSLVCQKDWVSACRIIVTDGGSTDGTQGIVRRLAREIPNLRLVDNPGRLQSAGVNLAVATCAEPRHRILVRCDVHAIYPPGYVRTLAEELRRVGSASVVTAMDATGGEGFQKAAAWIVDTPLGSGGSAHRGGRKAQFVDHGHHAAFDLDWFRHVGGYDPAINYNEDAEYDLRLARAGGKIWLTDRTRIAYTMRPSLRSLWRQYWRYGRGRANTLTKHRTMPRLRQIAPVMNVWLLAASMAAMVVTPLALFWPALYAILLIGASIAAAVSLRGIGGLWAGPALAAMHLAWGLGFTQRILEGPGATRKPQIQTG